MVCTALSGGHYLVVNENKGREMPCDFLLHPDFFDFLTGIYAFDILREQVNVATAAILAVFVIF